MTLQELKKAKLFEETLIVWGRTYGNNVGKCKILSADYRGFKNKQGAIIEFVGTGIWAFVAYEDIRAIHTIPPRKNTSLPELNLNIRDIDEIQFAPLTERTRYSHVYAQAPYATSMPMSFKKSKAKKDTTMEEMMRRKAVANQVKIQKMRELKTDKPWTLGRGF